MADRLPLPHLERIHTGKQVRQIRHDYTEDELHALREDFTELSMKLSDEKEALKEVRREFKARIDELEVMSREKIVGIRNRFIDNNVECYLVPNFDSGDMEFYSAKTGELVDSRRLRPDERQMNIIQAAAA